MSSSMESTQTRVKSAVDEMINDIDKTHLRDMQKSMFLCSSKCCDDKKGARDSVERCIEQCNFPMQKAQANLERELGQLQDQLSRCAMTCYDKLVQEYGSDQSKYSPDVMKAFTSKLDKCVSVCADDHIKIIPTIKSRFAKGLEDGDATMIPLLLVVLVSALPGVASFGWPIFYVNEKVTIDPIDGELCAYGDFNHDRATDLLLLHDKRLVVWFQDSDRKNFTKANFEFPPLKANFDQVACSMGDFNGDGLPDVVISTRKGNEWSIQVIYLDGMDKMTFKEGVSFDQMKLKDQVESLDVDGDGQHDLMGVYENGTLMCKLSNKLQTTVTPQFDQDCSYFFNEWTGDLHPKMPILFGDINNDLRADIIFMKLNDGKLKPEVWKRSNEVWSKMEDLPEPSEGFSHTLTPLLFDLDLDREMDLLVPVCSDKDCTTLKWIMQTKFVNGQWNGWKNIPVNLGTATLYNDEHSLSRVQVGDYSLDGFPDLVATLKLNNNDVYPGILENRAKDGQDDMSKERRFEYRDSFLSRSIIPLTGGTIQSSYFFDYFEDGYLDTIWQWKSDKDGTYKTGINVRTASHEDATFLKVYTVAPLPKRTDIKGGQGVAWGGTCVKYEMETTEMNSQRGAIDCQVTATSHKAGLVPPFSLFGLGRNPNFVDVVTISVPRSFQQIHVQKQIVPNARMVVQPPNADGSAWVLRLYLTPSSLIVASVCVMTAVCIILLLVVVCLHMREKKLDRVERQLQSHRFHFDAM